jgi:serine-type D-Ala-D-Ala carboxypeptidase/endopeptidase
MFRDLHPHPSPSLGLPGMTVRDVWYRSPRLAFALLSLISRNISAQSAPVSLDPVEVRGSFIPRVNDGTFYGIAAGWVEGTALRSAAAGVTIAHGTAIDATTRFELGEAGEMFTTALLASLVAKGELSLDDLAQRFLPPPIQLPHRLGRAITLGDLAFHRAGLPNVTLSAGASTQARVTRTLRGITLRSDIGSRYAYSQLGIEVLGLALSRHLRMPLATAVQLRLFSPLGLTDIAPSSESRVAARDATGHTASGTAVSLSTPASGNWRATIVAITRFAIAASDTTRGPLASTFALMMRTRSLGPDPTLPVALGWRVLRLDGRDIYWHDAQDAPGFSAYVAMDPLRHRAAAVLSNTARSVDAVAGALLLGRLPLIDAAPPLARPTSQATARRAPRRRSRR